LFEAHADVYADADAHAGVACSSYGAHAKIIERFTFSITAGLIVEMVFELFSILLLCNGLKTGEYKA